MNKFKFLGLAAVLAAFCFVAHAQTVKTDSTTSITGVKPVVDSLSSVTVGQLGDSSALTVIVGHDTLHVKDTVNIPSVGPIIPADHIGNIPVPAWAQVMFIVLSTIVFTVLPAIQAVLKVIPTPESVKMQGWLGKILDFATGFIKDAKLGGGIHS